MSVLRQSRLFTIYRQAEESMRREINQQNLYIMMHPKLTFGLVDGPTGLKITVKDCQVTQIEIWFLIFALLVWEWVFVELNEDEKLTRLASTT